LKDNIKMELAYIELGIVDWIGLAQDRYSWRALVNAVMKLRVPYTAEELPSGCTTSGHSSATQLHRINYLVIVIYISTLVPGRYF
jgi:hypothetical protein